MALNHLCHCLVVNGFEYTGAMADLCLDLIESNITMYYACLST
jgi:hypothetical protein